MSVARLEVEAILQFTAAAIPAALLDRIVVIGSLASAWAFRDLDGSEAVATKDIDLLLHPSMWWLADQQSVRARRQWPSDWQQALRSTAMDMTEVRSQARQALAHLSAWQREAHRLASTGLLAGHTPTLEAWLRAAAGLDELLR